jgi:hypothetical protein
LPGITVDIPLAGGVLRVDAHLCPRAIMRELARRETTCHLLWVEPEAGALPIPDPDCAKLVRVFVHPATVNAVGL